jgi:hypothetical protein
LFGLDFVHWLVVLSAVISVAGSYAYIKDTLAGKTKPNRVSWSMWAIAPLIGTGAALSSGADFWATVRIFLAGFIPLLVFFVSFANRQGYWKITKFDSICGVFSLAAFIAWLAGDSPRVAIFLAVLGDGFACLPTIVKAWKHPETETGVTYLASFVSVLLVIPSIPVWNIENSAFQVYLLIASTLLLVAVYRKKLDFKRIALW